MASKAKIVGVTEAELQIVPLKMDEVRLRILGDTPLIFNRVSQKGIKELLLPARKKNTAERATTLKHDPIGEYRASPYVNKDSSRPALFHMPSGAFKGAIGTAALDTPGAKKAQVGRLLSIPTPQIDVYGVPQIMASVVRMADVGRTPDIRFRAILPEWACEIVIRFPGNLLSVNSVGALLAAAGIIVGVGDFRIEKGKGSFGGFSPVGMDDQTWVRIVREQGRKVQLAALNNPEPYDEETREMLEWFDGEIDRRGNLKVPSREVTIGGIEELVGS